MLIDILLPIEIWETFPGCGDGGGSDDGLGGIRRFGCFTTRPRFVFELDRRYIFSS